MSSRPRTPSDEPPAFTFGTEWRTALDATESPPSLERDQRNQAAFPSSPVFQFGQSSPATLPAFSLLGAEPAESGEPLKSSPSQQESASFFRFGSDSSLLPPDSSPKTASTPRQDFKPNLPIFHLGNEPTFSFRQLHNASPLPPDCEESLQWRAFSASPSSSPPPNVTQTRKVTDAVKQSLGSPFSAQASLSPDRSPQVAHSSRQKPQANITSNLTAAPEVYDVRDEQAPPHPFFTNDFQRSLEAGLVIAKKTVRLIEQTSPLATDETSKRLLDDAKGLCSFHGSDTRTIAVLGDSGEGKSSLINSLLHFPGIAKTGDIGSACTSVVTEYRQKASHHTEPIAIEVEYLSTTEIEDMVSELLWSYRQLYLPLVQQDETSASDYAKYERESAQAWSALEAAFKHHKQFKEESLQDQSEGAFERLREQLVGWSHEIQWPDGGLDGKWIATASTARECCEKTAIFMGDRYWPFTKIIRVYLSAQVLKTGVILADLPGLQDTNLARVRATQDYLMKCHNVFIVAKISRAITDQSLKSSLFSVLARHIPLEWEESGAKAMNIAVVCTKTEDINIDVARQEFCGLGKRIAPSVIEKLDDDIALAKASGERAQKKILKQSRDLLFIQARNQHVIEGLKRSYASKIPNGDLDVFCISNKMYEKQSRKGNKQAVLASGIPEVRKFCLKITADAQLREARHFLQSSLLSLVNSVEMWASSQGDDDDAKALSEDTRRGIRETVAQTRTDAAVATRKVSDDFNASFRDLIQRVSRRHPDWQAAATVEGERWQKWHWTQYNAWCINSGKHETPKREREDWNAKIIWKMRSELEYNWSIVQDEIPVIFTELRESLETLLVDVRDKLSHPISSELYARLADGINSRIISLQYKLEHIKETFEGEVKLTWRYASESNYTSYVLKEMIPTYRFAVDQNGPGKASRQRSIVQGRITDGIMFPSISIAISNRIHDVLRQTSDELTEAFERIMEGIDSDLNFALSSQATKKVHASNGTVDVPETLRRIKRLREKVEGLGRASTEK